MLKTKVITILNSTNVKKSAGDVWSFTMDKVLLNAEDQDDCECDFA